MDEYPVASAGHALGQRSDHFQTPPSSRRKRNPRSATAKHFVVYVDTANISDWHASSYPNEGVFFLARKRLAHINSAFGHLLSISAASFGLFDRPGVSLYGGGGI